MDEKEKDLNTELPLDSDADYENDSSLEEKNGVKYETNDNWEFEAEAPTLNNDLFSVPDFPEADNKTVASGEYIAPNDYSAERQIVVNRDIFTFVPLAIFVAAVIAVLAVLGVRYYTVPNGKEGDLMNPASVVATIDESKISLGMYNLYFSSVVSEYEQYASYYGIDTTADYATQYTTDEDGNKISWLEVFQRDTLEELKTHCVLCDAAKKEGITLSTGQQKMIDDYFENLKESASEQNVSLNEYISDLFGDYCTEETFRLYMERFYMAINYQGKYAVENKPESEEIDKFYEENKKNYYQINFSYLALTYDSSTDETKQKSEETIKDYAAKIKDRQSILDLVPTVYKEYIDNDAASAMEADSSLSEKDAIKQATANYEANIDGQMSGTDTQFGEEISNWLFDENEPTGSTKYYINKDMGYAYIILKTEQPTHSEDEVYSVRHILIMPETDREDAETDESGNTVFNEEEWAAAEKKAKKILDEYNSGDKTELSFAAFAEEESDDVASTGAGGYSGRYGGLCENVSKGDMVSEFESWALDKQHEFGDVEIVKSQFGYHIMFFISKDVSYKAQLAKDVRDTNLQKIVDDTELSEHSSVLKKANDKFLVEKKTANESSSSGNLSQGY